MPEFTSLFFRSFEETALRWSDDKLVFLNDYQHRKADFVAEVPPELLLSLSVYELLDILQKRLGFPIVQQCLNPEYSHPSPRAGEPDSTWLKSTNMVGINVRTIHHFTNILKYVLSLPTAHRCIHLLPIWEPGVVGSLYGMASWEINPEFFCAETSRVFPQLDTSAKQLKVVINLLHALGFTVGMDVIPHNDRFSEVVLMYPRFFEWIRRDDTAILDHRETLWQEVERCLYDELASTSQGSLPSFEELFGEDLFRIPEAQRQQLLFGAPSDNEGRLRRRVALMRALLRHGFETLPMTMAPPYRGLHLSPEIFETDDTGQRWFQYSFDRPEAMSRVFGPLTRYRLHHSLHDNNDWQLDFSRPNESVWEYVTRKYLNIQRYFGFDFMRGDMTHVQMQPQGVPALPGPHYDLLRAVKKRIQRESCPWFAFFAESFVVAPDLMGYGDEVAHLEAIEADATLGDLQSTTVGSSLFISRFRQYLDLADTRGFAPSFTVLTADKDDPRFDAFFQTGNTVRYFIALFLPDLPSYVSLGFETRGKHLQRVANESYTKLYVFQIEDPKEIDKCTQGPFVWERDWGQFGTVAALRKLSDHLGPELGEKTQWLTHPDPTESCPYIAWKIGAFVFVVNLNCTQTSRHVTLPNRWQDASLELYYSTAALVSETPTICKYYTTLAALAPEECRIYQVVARKNASHEPK